MAFYIAVCAERDALRYSTVESARMELIAGRDERVMYYGVPAYQPEVSLLRAPHAMHFCFCQPSQFKVQHASL